MKLIYRPTEERDLSECVCLVLHGLSTERGANRLFEVWRSLRQQGAFNSAVMEDQERPLGERLVHFGASVFVTDEFVQEARTHPQPCLSEVVLDRSLAGQSPTLDAAAIRRANTGNGLNVFVLHTGIAAHLRPDERQAIIARGPDTFFLVHQGFSLKEILLQFPDTEDQQFAMASGFQVRSQAMGLFGLTRAEAHASPGAYASRLFLCEPP